MTNLLKDVPLGIRFIEWISGKCQYRRLDRMTWHRAGVLGLTYLAYTCYHMSRKPISVVKNVLSFNCSGISPPPDLFINDSNRDTWCDWAPFDKPNASALLGTLDSAFLFSYAAAMFLSGFLAERFNLRYFLALGMLGTGIFTYLFGIARSYNIHNLWYFIFIQGINGILQTSGWPGVVTVVGNWFGKGKRGLIFGIWNSHTSLGNILGSLIAAEFVEKDWGLSFMVPGVIMGISGFIIFLFLVPNPSDIGYIPPGPYGYRKLDVAHSSDEGSGIEDAESIHNDDRDLIYQRSETSPMLSTNRNTENSSEKAIGFLGAISIPGVIEYSLSLFFAKLVSYTFLFWLPQYISSSTTYSATLSADLSTLFDVGGIIGAIIAGVLSDYSGMSALTCAVMLALACPTLFIYDYIGSMNLVVNVLLLMLAGLLVNGPYALITTAVSAELGTHPSLGVDSKALATVAAIIDGTGSIGAAVGPLLAGFVSSQGNLKNGWHNVYYVLVASEILALVLLSKLVYKDLKLYAQRWRAV
ncbi:PREDICTED: sugar phosphate exchanger 2 isoform X2 [Ceratosolen solmsi marchali]|uniref:Sugar phosphate exchanger 3 n=1 Tax=Ceratosolen solmsi marchali TaxID=326594 RepID=A0AAJ6YK88_9HYME|nr:PREDICTED: sugar phosphate exchanger 2 isoform X2 [Ceratosolen solmsi marchali]